MYLYLSHAQNNLYFDQVSFLHGHYWGPDVLGGMSPDLVLPHLELMSDTAVQQEAAVT